MTTPIHFWSWFTIHQKQFTEMMAHDRKEQKRLTQRLRWHLYHYLPGTDYVLIYPNGSGQAQMIITANGIRENFARVDALIKAAPEMKDWAVSAFLLPREDYMDIVNNLDDPYIIQEATIKGGILKNLPFDQKRDAAIDMGIYLKNFSMLLQSRNLLQAIYIIINGNGKTPSPNDDISFVQVAQVPQPKKYAMVYLYDFYYYTELLNNNRP